VQLSRAAVREFHESVKNCRGYERISSGMIFDSPCVVDQLWH